MIGLGTSASQGSALVRVWLQDNVDNVDLNNVATVNLRYDSVAPTSYSTAPATASAGPLAVWFTADDPGAGDLPPTGSGLRATTLWFRKDNNGDGVFGAWQAMAGTLAEAAGQFSLTPSGDGQYQFYTQAADQAGNTEPEPTAASPPKAETYYDGTPPVISNVSVPLVAYAAAEVQWNTDDVTTGYVQYGTSTTFGHQTPLDAAGQAHLASLDCHLLSPATIYYRITAINKTGLQTQSAVGSFVTPPLVTVPSNLFGVVTGTQTILVQVNNPDLVSGTFSIGGQSGTLVPGTTNVFQITLDPGLSGYQTLSINLGGYIYNTSFIVDTATRTVRLARLVMDAGGVMTSTEATPGSSMLDASAGEAVVGPPSDQSSGEMSSGNSRLLLGYYSGIDPVAPGPVAGLTSAAGPGAGEATLSWTATGNDADVGTAMVYDLRYSTLPITEANFSQAQTVALSTYPAAAGTPQQALVSGLAGGTTYFFALKALDGQLNESGISAVPSAETYSVAQSTDQTAGHPTVTLISNVSGIGIALASSTGTVPSVALATSAAAAQGLVFASPIYSVQSPLDPLPGGATMQFYYDPTGLDPALQQQLRIYHLSAGSTSWTLVADVPPVLSNGLLIAPVSYLSLFAVMLPDHVPPQVSLATQGGRKFLSPSGSLFVSRETVFGLSARDPPLGRLPGTGVASVRFRVDSATAPLTALDYSTETFRLAPGAHTIDYDAVDAGGNASPLLSATVGVDAAAPEVLVSVDGGSYGVMPDPLVVDSTAPVLSFEFVDPLAPGNVGNGGAGISSASYSVDGGSFAVVASSFSLTLGLGTHALAVFAEDAVGNLLDRSTAPYRLVIGDNLPPRTALTISTPEASGGSLADAFVSRRTTFTLTSVDDLSAVGDGQGLGVAFQQLTVDGFARAQFVDAHPGQGQVFVSSFSLSADSDGVHAVGYLAQDTIQNREAVHITTVAVDNTPPETWLAVSSPSFGAYLSTAAVVSLTAMDPMTGGVASGVSAVLFRDNGAVFQSYSSTFSLSAGAHALEYYAEDRVQNVELPKSTTLYVDADPPVSSVFIGTPAFTATDGAVYVSTASPLTFSAVDPVLASSTVAGSGVARVEVSLDSAPFVAVSSAVFLSEGTHALSYRALDNVGNAESARILLARADATAPVTTLAVSTPVAGGYVTAATVFTLSALDPQAGGAASGVAFTRYAVDGGAFVDSSSTFTLHGPDGAYTIQYQSQDEVRNLEVLHSTTVYLDDTPPEVAVRVGSPTFTAADGAVYVTPGTPVTFEAVDPSSGTVASGVDRIEVAVDSAPFAVYAATLTFSEGRHTVAYRAVDKVGNLSAVRILSLRSDATAPITAFTPSAAFFNANGHDYAPAGFSYALTANDPVTNDVASGVAAVRYALDGGAFQLYASTFGLTEGVRAVTFLSEDHVGNVELAKSATVYVDATAPVTALTIGAPQFQAGGTLFVSTMTPFTLVPQDPVTDGVASGVRSLTDGLDGAAQAPYVSTITLTLPEGARTLAWQATDNVGNQEVLKSSAVFLDAAAPETSLAVIGGHQAPGPDASTFYASSDTRLALISTDTASGVAFTRLQDGGGTFQLYLTTFTLAEGAHTLGYQSQDRVQNLEVLRSTTVLVDATAPVSTATVGSPLFAAVDGTLFVSTATPVTLTAADPALPGGRAGSGVARIETALDGGAFVPYNAPLTFAEGRHTLVFRAVDALGNIETQHTLALSADATPPVSSLTIGQPQFALSTTTLLVSAVTPLGVAAQDPVVASVASGVQDSYYRVFDAAPSTAAFAVFSASFTLAPADGPKTVEFYSRDHVLNTEVVKSRTLLLDSAPPSVTLISPHAGTGICSVVNGKVSVQGSVADAHFAFFSLDFAAGQNATTGYILVSSGTAAVDGTLGVWDASKLAGWQTLRLTATDEVLNVAVTTVTVFVGDPATLMVLGNDALFNMPQSVATDAAGNIFVADTNDNTIQIFTAVGSSIAVLGRATGRDDHDGRSDAAISTSTLVLNKPQGVAVNSDGSIWIADTNDERVVKVSSSGAVLFSVGRTAGKKDEHDKNDQDEAANSVPGSALGEFNHPAAVALDAAGNIFVADNENHRVQKLGPDGSPILAFSLPPLPGRTGDEDRDGHDDARSAPLGRPAAIALDSAGKVYVADPDGGRALVFGATGQLLLTIPISGGVDDGRSIPGQPDGIAVSPDGSCILVGDALSDRVFKFDALGDLTLSFGVHGRHTERKAGVRLNKPAGLAFAPDGTLLVADRNNDRVERYGTPNGQPTLVTPPDPDDPEFVVREVLDKDEGGRVERDDKAAVTVPAGALPDDLKISVSTMSPSSLADADHMQKVAESEGMKPGYAAVEYGPEGTQFKTPVTLTIPYDPNLVAMEGMSEDSLKVRYWDPKKGDWETMPSTVNKADHTVTAKTPHFSLYQVLGSTGTGAAPLAVSADPTFTFHDAYAFPNPVRGVRAVTLRVQPGLADSVVVRVYDLSGRKIHQSSDFRQSIIDDGNGKGYQYTYDHVWDISGVGSGVYFYVITATKAGKSDIHKAGRVGVIK